MPDPRKPPVVYLDVDMVAQRLDVPAEAIRDWTHRRLLPQPNAVESGQPLWTSATINAWAAQFHQALE